MKITNSYAMPINVNLICVVMCKIGLIFAKYTVWDEIVWKNLKYLQEGTHEGTYEPRK